MRWPVRQRREVAAKCDWQENNCVEEEENTRRLIYATGKGKKEKKMIASIILNFELCFSKLPVNKSKFREKSGSLF